MVLNSDSICADCICLVHAWQEEIIDACELMHVSLQVLSKALDVWNLEIIPMDSPAMAAVREHPENESAMICNLQEHWFTVRAIFSDWWNFNSLFPAPQHLSSFYLSAFLGSLKDQGYTIFVVRGELPSAQPPADATTQSDGPGVWISPAQVTRLKDLQFRLGLLHDSIIAAS